MNIIIILAIIHAFLFALTLTLAYQKAKKMPAWIIYAAFLPIWPVIHAIFMGTDVNRLAMRRIQSGYQGCPRCRGWVCHPDCVNMGGHKKPRHRKLKNQAKTPSMAPMPRPAPSPAAA